MVQVKGRYSRTPGPPSGSTGNNADGGAWPGEKPAVVKRTENKLMGFAAAVLARGNANDGHVQSSRGKTSAQHERAEAEKETRAKVRGSE